MSVNKAIKRNITLGGRYRSSCVVGRHTVLHRKCLSKNGGVCEVGGIRWWSGYTDFKRTEGKYVVMWPRDLGEISVSLRLSKYVELQLCNKNTVSPVKHNIYLL